MDRPDPSSIGVALLRSIAIAVWTWVAFAAVSAGVLVRTAEQLPDRADATIPSTFPDAFLGVLTLDVGESVAYGQPAVAVAFEHLPATLLFLGKAAVVAAVLGGALVVLSRTRAGDRRFVEGLGYLGALPVTVVLFGLYALSLSTGSAWLSPGPHGPLGDWLEAAALALPIAAAAGRALAREARDRGWLIDAWLFVSWTLGSVVLVEYLAGIHGLGYLFSQAVSVGDAPVVVAASAMLVLVGLLAVVARELALFPASRGPSEPTDARTGTALPDGGAVAADRSPLFRGDRRVQAGLAGFGLLLVIGVVGSVVVDPAPRSGGEQSLVAATVGGLGVTALTAVGVAVIAGVVGVALGVLSDRVRYGRTVSAIAVGFTANVPLLVWAWFAPSMFDLAVPVSVWLGIGVSPLVALAAARDLDGRGTVSLASLRPALGVAATGAAVATLVVAQLHALGLPFTSLTVAMPPSGGAVTRLAVAVGLPVVSLLLLGEGLRRR